MKKIFIVLIIFIINSPVVAAWYCAEGLQPLIMVTYQPTGKNWKGHEIGIVTCITRGRLKGKKYYPAEYDPHPWEHQPATLWHKLTLLNEYACYNGHAEISRFACPFLLSHLG